MTEGFVVVLVLVSALCAAVGLVLSVKTGRSLVAESVRPQASHEEARVDSPLKDSEDFVTESGQADNSRVSQQHFNWSSLEKLGPFIDSELFREKHGEPQIQWNRLVAVVSADKRYSRQSDEMDYFNLEDSVRSRYGSRIPKLEFAPDVTDEAMVRALLLAAAAQGFSQDRLSEFA